MSTLTQNEREGLDEVFLSINSSNNNYNICNELSTFIIFKKKGFSLLKLLKQANYGVKRSGFAHILSLKHKKKKKLSK